jgi:MFS family permease
VLFAIGLLAGGLAPSMPILVIARFLQGLGAGAISPIAYVAIGRSLPHSLRAAMFAVLALAWVLPALVGPALAGLIGEHIGWRVVFLGLLPLIALSGALTFSALARIPGADDPSADGARTDRSAAQLRDAVLVVLGAGLATAGLTSVSLVPGVPLVAIGVVLTVPAFGRLTPPGTLRGAPGLPAAVLLRGVMTFAFFCADAYVPLALQDWRGTSPSVAGIALTAASLAWSAGAWLQARRVTRWGPRVFVASGLICVALGTVGFAAVLIPTVPIALGIAAWAVAGLGMGLSYSMLSLVTLAEAPPGEEGAATSGLQLSDLLGTSLGTGVGGALIAAGLASGLEIWTGLAGAFGVGAAAALGALVLAGRMPGRAAWRAHSLRTATPHA